MDLPWRNITDPYLIWVSEVILQQTQVAQGLNYYLRFIQAFPTFKDLAVAQEDEVLRRRGRRTAHEALAGFGVL